jgi:NhaP-type Na+/H+ or K+/H+ antiporter
MLYSIALIFLCGMLLGSFAEKIKLPGLLGMLIVGIILGPSVLNLMSPELMGIAPELRQIALVIILTRAGLSLNIHDLKKVGRPALLMCFVPACFEITGMIVFAPIFLHISILEAAIMGAVIAAVSPAVVVPRMLRLMDEGYGTDKGIPQMIVTGSSADDVFDIVLFTTFASLAQGGKVSAGSFVQVPASIIIGILVGVIYGFVISYFFKNVHIRDSLKVIILLGIAFVFVSAEQSLKDIVPFSGLIAVMSSGMMINRKRREVADRLSSKFSKLWVATEIVLFVLVGASVDIKYAMNAGISALIVIFGALLFRMAGVFCCMIKTRLTIKERLFCMIAYIPKATVQAAIGGVPLAMGLPCGPIVLTVAVVAILVTAPLGAFGTDMTYKKLLRKAQTEVEAKPAV